MYMYRDQSHKVIDFDVNSSGFISWVYNYACQIWSLSLQFLWFKDMAKVKDTNADKQDIRTRCQQIPFWGGGG